MKIKLGQIVSLVGVIFSILGCQSGKGHEPTVESVKSNKIAAVDITYLDEKLYSDHPDKKSQLTLINQSVIKFNERDKEGFLNLFYNPEDYAPVYEHLTKEKNPIILNVSNPRFRNENVLVTVTVDKKCSIDNGCGGEEYSFTKVGDKWKLIFID